jgi:sulfoxide reductase heme-binding subunit YedZ
MTASDLTAWLPWTDRAGRTSWIKLVTFLAMLAPAVWMLTEWRMGWLSPKPVTDLVRESGDWAMRILILSLAVTPLRYVARFNRVILVRRMVGLAALFYTLAHIALWCVDLRFDWLKIVMELVLRLFLTVGLAATVILVALGVTSNDLSIRKLGAARWNKLHGLVYAATFLSLVHYFMEVRLDASEAALMCGYFILLMSFRAVRQRTTPGFINLALAAFVCAVMTGLMEALYYKLSTSVSVSRVLMANFDVSYRVSPALWVLGVGLAVAALAHLRARFGPKPARLARA